ncbi:recombinase [Vallitalea longa]|uniref:Recombinase n=1 Tax=Vallitalea longa TaxID=2936439 RepID=A0A9W5Y7U3_9FIRM|nr:recombinase family protein [Vallitalea longa]GKX27929.1 recombinase [Vallitalea longa]
MIAIYARQSIDKKDSISIESQIDFCKKEFTTEEYRVYTDKGFSGSNTNRPQFEQMLKDIKHQDISKVIVYKLDRISRSILDFAKIIELFKKYHVEFTSATEKFDTSTPMGNAMLNITMVFAQLERETIQRRIKDSYYARGKKGFFMGGKTPYGCIKEQIAIDGVKTSTLKPNPEEYNVLIKIFDLYSISDLSLGKLAASLNEEGYKSPNGVNWDGQKLQRILRNPVYVKADADIYTYFENKGCKINNDISEFIGTNGCYLYGKRDRNASKYTNIQDHVLSLALHEGFINSHIWLSCQYKLDSNRQIKNSGKGKHSWLSGLVKCGYCNYAMTVKTYKDYKYLSCTGRTNYKVCDRKQRTHYVYEIEDYVKNELTKQLANLKAVKQDTPKEVSYELNQLKLQLINIDKQIDNLINQLAQGNEVITNYINKKIVQLDSEKNDILEEIDKHTRDDKLSQEQILDATKDISLWNELTLEEKKRIARRFINKVFVTDDVIKIEWKS